MSYFCHSQSWTPQFGENDHTRVHGWQNEEKITNDNYGQQAANGVDDPAIEKTHVNEISMRISDEVLFQLEVLFVVLEAEYIHLILKMTTETEEIGYLKIKTWNCTTLSNPTVIQSFLNKVLSCC